MEIGPGQGAVGFEDFHVLVVDLVPGGSAASSSSARTVSPVLVVVAAMVLTMTSWLVRGLPRQLITCGRTADARLFHFEVPGERWQTVMVRPVDSASSVFPSRVR